MLYWVETPLWIGGSLAITAITVVGRFVAPLDGPARGPRRGVFVWACAGAAAMPLRLGRIVPAVGAATRVILLGGFTLTVALYAARHGVHGFGAADFAPSRAGFFAVVPVLVYNYLGFDLPVDGRATSSPTRAATCRSPCAAPARAPSSSTRRPCSRSCSCCRRRGSPGSAGSSTRSRPSSRSTAATSTRTAASRCRVPGTCSRRAAVLFVLVLVTSGATWLMGTARSQAIACLDGAGPATLGAIDARTGTPLRLCVVSGVVASATSTLAFAVSGGDAERYFAVALGLAISAIAISYLAIFPALAVLRRRYPTCRGRTGSPAARPAPSSSAALATASVAVAVAALAWPGIGTGDPDAALPAGFAGERALFEVCELVPLGALVVLGFAVRAAGAHGRDAAASRVAEPAFAEV